jgi:hypothetical protein
MLDRFGDMADLDLFRAGEICDGAADVTNAAVSEDSTWFVDCGLQQLLGSILR